MCATTPTSASSALTTGCPRLTKSPAWTWSSRISGHGGARRICAQHPVSALSNINIQKLSNPQKSDSMADAWFINATRRTAVTLLRRGVQHGTTGTPRVATSPTKNDVVDYENQRRTGSSTSTTTTIKTSSSIGRALAIQAAAITPSSPASTKTTTCSRISTKLQPHPDYEEPFLRHYIDPPDFSRRRYEPQHRGGSL